MNNNRTTNENGQTGSRFPGDQQTHPTGVAGAQSGSRIDPQNTGLPGEGTADRTSDGFAGSGAAGSEEDRPFRRLSRAAGNAAERIKSQLDRDKFRTSPESAGSWRNRDLQRHDQRADRASNPFGQAGQFGKTGQPGNVDHRRWTGENRGNENRGENDRFQAREAFGQGDRFLQGDRSQQGDRFQNERFRPQPQYNESFQRNDRSSQGGGYQQNDRFQQQHDDRYQQAGRFSQDDGLLRGENEDQRDRFQYNQYQDRDQDAGAERNRGSKWWQSEAPNVEDVMTKNPKTVGPEASIRDVAEIMRQEDVGVVPIVRGDGRLLGLITDRDIVVRGLVPGKGIDDFRAKDLATKDIEVVSVHDQLSDVIDLMGRQQIRRVPVLDDSDRLVGIVSLGDVANRADYDEELQNAFEKISGRRSFWSRIWR